MSQFSYFEKVVKRFGQNSYINIFGWKDTSSGSLKSKSYLCTPDNIQPILKSIKNFNNKGTGVGYCINPLISANRDDGNVSKILTVPIDIDQNPTQEEAEQIAQELINLGLYANYFSQTGHGYHIILDVELKTEDWKYVKNFLTFLKNNVSEKVDAKIFNPSRIIRAPETFHWKDGKKEVKIIFEDAVIREDKIKSNSDIIRTFTGAEEKKKAPENKEELSKELNRPDIFFTELLGSESLWNYLANKSSIEKNDKLLKNLAAFDTQTDGIYSDKIKDFIEKIDHVYEEYEGWLNKEIEVNYEELRNWINDYDLEALKPFIREQLTKDSNFINEFQFCYVESVAGAARYLIFHIKEKYWSFHTKSQALEFLFLRANQKSIDLATLFGLIYIEGWEDFKISKKQGMITERIYTYLYDNQKINQIYDIGYLPQREKFFVRNEKLFFNIYKPGPLEFYKGEKSLEEYKFPFVKKLLEHLYGSQGEEALNFAFKWYAYIKQNPGHKLPTSLIVKSTPGAGKGRLKQWIIGGIWGHWNISEIDQTNLDNVWGDYLLNKRWIFCNEIKLNSKTNPRVYARIKQQSCDEEFEIQQKNRAVETFYNQTHWNFFTNEDDFMVIEDEDRRFVIYDQPKKIPKNIVNKLSPELNPGYLEEELKEFSGYLDKLKVAFVDVDSAIATKIKNDLQNNNKDTIDNFFEEMKEYGNIEDFANVFSLLIAQKVKESFILTSDFHRLYLDWCFKNNMKFQKSLKGFAMVMKSRYKLESNQDRSIEVTNRRFYWIEDIKKIMDS